MPFASKATVQVRFAEGAPQLDALIGSSPQSICSSQTAPCYLQVNGKTVVSLFIYGQITNFITLPAGALSLVALDDLGYRVGPVATPSLTAGKAYTVALVGIYPHYRALAFEEPASASSAQISLYEASPAVPSADFGTFLADKNAGYKRLGSAKLGEIATIALGKTATNVGGYVGKGTTPFGGGTLTIKQVNSFDKRNELPFHNVSRFSLFVFDVKSGASGPVFGALDR
jgi:hypothetical protein